MKYQISTYKHYLFLIPLVMNILTSCHSTSGDQYQFPSYLFPEQVIDETFDEADRPAFELVMNDSAYNYYFCKPWNYNKDYNADRKYPLVIYLHGNRSTSEPVDPVGLSYLGHDHVPSTATKFKTTYPCFVYVPQTGGYWNATTLIGQIETIRSDYRIDPTRTYIIGYSMGGAGSFSLANGYYDYNKHIIAGIIRLAGYAEPTLRSTLYEKTSVWLHVGLLDSTGALNTARNIYNDIRNFHPDADQTSKQLVIPNYHTGTTVTLTKDHVEIVKKTEYDEVGHGVSNFPFVDNQPIQWLFNQSTALR